MPSLPTRRRYQSGVATTLSAGISDVATTFSIVDTTGWPNGAGDPFYVTIDPGTASEERVLCSSRSTTTVTVASGGRGADGTTAKAHGAGAVVWPSFSATDADEANAHASASGSTSTVNVHGLAQGSSVVGTDDSQTLTNKTLTSPIINSATLTSPTINSATAQSLVVIGPEERCNVVAAAATGTINFDALTAGVWVYTSNASANFTLNFRGNSGTALNSLLATGDAVTLVFVNTNGSTPYYPTVFQIDGNAVTPLWQGGSAPSGGNASSRDAYTFTIIKTAATPAYLVLAAQTRFA